MYYCFILAFHNVSVPWWHPQICRPPLISLGVWESCSCRQQHRVPPACVMKSIHNMSICVCFLFLCQLLCLFMCELVVFYVIGLLFVSFLSLSFLTCHYTYHRYKSLYSNLIDMHHTVFIDSAVSIFILSSSSLSWCHPAAQQMDSSDSEVMAALHIHIHPTVWPSNAVKIDWALAPARGWSW